MGSADAAFAVARREVPPLDATVSLSRSVLYMPGVGAGLLGTCTLIAALSLEVPATVVVGVGAVLAQERIMKQLAHQLEEEVFAVSFAEQCGRGQRTLHRHGGLTRSIALAIFHRRPKPQVRVSRALACPCVPCVSG